MHGAAVGLIGLILTLASAQPAKQQPLNDTGVWLEYKTCKQNERNGLGLHVKKAEAVFEDAQINLHCRICFAPNAAEESIEWQKDGKKLNHTGRIFSSIRATPTDAGIYTCTSKDEAKMTVALQILTEESEPMQQVKLHSNPAPRKNASIMTNFGVVVVYSEWGTKSQCSEKYNCGHVGLKRKYGPCMVDIKSFSSFSDKIWTNPIPCRSKLLPEELLTLKQISNRPSEVTYTFCRVKCKNRTEDGIFKKFDENGTLLDQADNSKGFFSLYQGVPHLPSPVKRSFQFPIRGEKLIIKCHGQFVDDSPIKWVVDGKVLTNAKMNRIRFTPMHNVLIKTVKTKDSKIFSCWQQKRLVGTIKVRVMVPGMTLFDRSWSILIVTFSASIIVIALIKIYLE